MFHSVLCNCKYIQWAIRYMYISIVGTYGSLCLAVLLLSVLL